MTSAVLPYQPPEDEAVLALVGIGYGPVPLQDAAQKHMPLSEEYGICWP
jgi:hypothetical protein